MLYEEIFEQPAVLAATLEREAPGIAVLATALAERRPALALIVARGTSDNAAVYGKYLLEAFAGLPVALAAPSLYTLYNRPPRLDQALVLAVSQSGRSPDLLAVLAEGRRQGAITAAIVNDEHSPLAELADHVLCCGAGVERAVAASKSYTAQLLLLAGLAAHVSGDAALHGWLAAVPEAVRAALALDGQLRELAQAHAGIDRLVLLGRGFAYATALEVALKVKETAYVVADAYSGADFLHGPIAVIEPGFPVLLIAAAGPTLPGMRELALTLAGRGALTMALTDDPELSAGVDHGVLLRTDLPEWLAPIAQVVAGQLFAYHLALARGHDPDQPRGLRKVTATR